MSWIETAEGFKFDYNDIRLDSICICDIAVALSRIPRFLGHSRSVLSVAQHSVHVSRLVSREHRMCALLHDAPEAYLGDMPTPLKNLSEMKGYRALEARVWKAIALKFDLPENMPQEVLLADRVAFEWEYRALKPRTSYSEEWKADYRVEHAPPFVFVKMDLWDARAAEEAFHEAFEEYRRERPTTTVCFGIP